jgi:hypothetical protein
LGKPLLGIGHWQSSVAGKLRPDRGRNISAPGNAWGGNSTHDQALKGRNKLTSPLMFRPFRACVGLVFIPRALPGADMLRPLWGKDETMFLA